MNSMATLHGSDKRLMVYKDLNDDGLAVEFSHGRFEWYRIDTGYYIDIYQYKYWSEL